MTQPATNPTPSNSAAPTRPDATATEALALYLRRRLPTATVNHTTTDIAVRIQEPPLTALIQLGEHTWTITTHQPPRPPARRSIGRSSHTPAQVATLVASTIQRPPRARTTPATTPSTVKVPTPPPRAAQAPRPRPTPTTQPQTPAPRHGLAATHPDIAAQLTQLARTTPTDPLDPTERSVAQPPLPPSLRRVADDVRHVLATTGRPLATGELTSRLQLDHGTPLRAGQLQQLRTSSAGMFINHDGRWSLPGWPRTPTFRRQLAGALRSTIQVDAEPTKPTWLEPSPTPNHQAQVPYTWTGFVQDLRTATTAGITFERPEVHVWDPDGRAVTHRFAIHVIFDADIHWITSTRTRVGSHTTERLYNTRMWTPWPSYAPHSSAPTPAAYLKHPDNPLIHTRIDATPEHLAWALAITIHNHLGVDDPSRVTVHKEPRPDDERRELRRQADNLGTVFSPKPVGGSRGGAVHRHHKEGLPILGRCVVCNQPLTDPASASRLMGDICYDNVSSFGHDLRINSHHLAMGDYLQRILHSRWPKYCWAAATTIDTWREQARIAT